MGFRRKLMKWFLSLIAFGVISLACLNYFNSTFVMRNYPYCGGVKLEGCPGSYSSLPRLVAKTGGEDINFMTDGFLENARDGYFPKPTVCHFTGLRKLQRKRAHKVSTRCKQHKPTLQACREANAKYGKPQDKLEDRVCDEEKYKDICVFTADKSPRLRCDWSVCEGSEISLGIMDNSRGILDWKPITPLSTQTVMSFVRKSQSQGHDFCFLQCEEGVGGWDVFQALVFPPRIRTGKKWSGKRHQINVNIIVLDSIARPHFYRVMRKSVSALRDVVYRRSINATVLDFELFQAIGQHTFENLRPLFSGKSIDVDHSKKGAQSLGIEVLFTRYKNVGYQTLFQEDLCWYDEWGIALSNMQIRPSMPDTPDMYRQRWKEFQTLVSKYNIDSYGLTHFSCPVVQKYGLTNHFDRPDQVCLNGKLYSSYYLDYLTSVYNRNQSNKSDDPPLLSYMHFNTGHTETGWRIMNMDKNLATFIDLISRDDRTLTIILSDHGHTRTSYANTKEGKRELYNPLLFMIIPHGVARTLGKPAVSALVKNQRRLFTTVDLHKALMTLNDGQRRSNDYRKAGLLAVLPSNRTCADLPIMPLAQCQCDGGEQRFGDNSVKHAWLAEYALGMLNNEIHNQYTKDQRKRTFRAGDPRFGYGRCSHLAGTAFVNIVERKSRNHVLITLDLHVKSSSGFSSSQDEVFQVAIKRHLDKNRLELAGWNRHSIYNKYKTCKDESVDVKLCVCEVNTTKSTLHNAHGEFQTLSGQPVFSAKPIVKTLHPKCLFLVRRKHGRLSIAYEIANICSHKKFIIQVYGSPDNAILTRPLPFYVMIRSRTMYFLLTAVRKVLNHSSLDIKISVTLIR